jgi:hypothetical protein
MDIGLSLGMKQAGASAGDGEDTPWYLAGGVDPANCVAAYQAKGAADYATSKVNLANPGTYDAYQDLPAAVPDWNVNTGWKCGYDAGVSTYVKTGYTPPSNGSHSLVVRYSYDILPPDLRTYPGLAIDSGPGFGFGVWVTVEHVQYFNGNTVVGSAVSPNSGVVAVAGNSGYINGVIDAQGIASDSGIDYELFIGGANIDTAAIVGDIVLYIQAAAFYSAVITAEQVAAITTATQAL